jgi:hypothetical protein
MGQACKKGTRMTIKEQAKAKKELKLQMDFLWSFIIRARVGFRCELYQKDRIKCGFLIQGAHLVTRSVPHTHYELRNGRSLCSSHHKFYTHKVEYWSRICDELWHDDWQYVTQDKWQGVKHADDLLEIFDFLRTEAYRQPEEFINDYRERFAKVEAFEASAMFALFKGRDSARVEQTSADV